MNCSILDIETEYKTTFSLKVDKQNRKKCSEFNQEIDFVPVSLAAAILIRNFL